MRCLHLPHVIDDLSRSLVITVYSAVAPLKAAVLQHRPLALRGVMQGAMVGKEEGRPMVSLLPPGQVGELLGGQGGRAAPAVLGPMASPQDTLKLLTACSESAPLSAYHCTCRNIHPLHSLLECGAPLLCSL